MADTKRHPTDLKHDAAKETVTRETEPKDEGTVETPQTPMRSEKIESGLCAVRGGAEEAKEASETKPPIPIENARKCTKDSHTPKESSFNTLCWATSAFGETIELVKVET